MRNIKKYRKANIPKALREQVWLETFGKVYEHSCHIEWCSNIINVFDFHVGHDIPESKGGTLTIDNLKPICARCNLSMGDNYTIGEWQNFKQNTGNVIPNTESNIDINKKDNDDKNKEKIIPPKYRNKKCFNCF
jgi:5-methylcytosine-specific restriction endonuclease McrA